MNCNFKGACGHQTMTVTLTAQPEDAEERRFLGGLFRGEIFLESITNDVITGNPIERGAVDLVFRLRSPE